MTEQVWACIQTPCFPPTELLMNHLQSIPPYFDFQP